MEYQNFNGDTQLPPAQACAKNSENFDARPLSPTTSKWLWASLGSSCALSAFWCAASDPVGVSLPLILSGGWALSVSIWGFIAALLAIRAHAGGAFPRLGWREWTAVVLAALLALVPAINANYDVRIANAFLLGLVCMVGFERAVSPRALGSMSPTEPLAAIGEFFKRQLSGSRLLRSLLKSREGNVLGVAVGLLFAFVVLQIAVPLLAAADPLFSSLTSNVFRPFINSGAANNVWRILRFMIIAIIAFSLLSSAAIADARQAASAPKAASAQRKPASIASVVTALGAIDACYLVFVFAEMSYLFGFAGSTGVAEYARSGFFQLVGVSVLNLAVLSLALTLRTNAPRVRAVTVLELVLVGVTAVMVVSSGWRMSLYVAEYGLSLLRLATFFGMAAIAVLLALAAARIANPSLRIFGSAALCVVALWLGFALCRPAAVVANYNVGAYLSGSLERMDVDYLYELGPDALAALERLSSAGDSEGAAAAATSFEAREKAHLLANEMSAEAWGERSVFDALA